MRVLSAFPSGGSGKRPGQASAAHGIEPGPDVGRGLRSAKDPDDPPAAVEDEGARQAGQPVVVAHGAAAVAQHREAPAVPPDERTSVAGPVVPVDPDDPGPAAQL